MTEQVDVKLAEWAGFQYMDAEYWVFKPAPNYESIEIYEPRWITPDGTGALAELPDFPHSTDACFKWLVLELWKRNLDIELFSDTKDAYFAHIHRAGESHKKPVAHSVVAEENPATAVCRAFESLIDIEAKAKKEA